MSNFFNKFSWFFAIVVVVIMSNQTNKGIEKSFDEIVNDVAALKNENATLNGKVDELEKKIEKQKDDFNEKFDNQKKKMDELFKRFNEQEKIMLAARKLELQKFRGITTRRSHLKQRDM